MRGHIKHAIASFLAHELAARLMILNSGVWIAAAMLLLGLESHASVLGNIASNESKIPRVAKGYYREHIFYRKLYTTPELYFHRLKHKGNVKTVLAIGDSWFAYPKNFLFIDFVKGRPSNILTNLDRLSEKNWNGKPLPLFILSLSNSGEIVRNMAGIARYNAVDVAASVQTDVNVFETISRSMERISAPPFSRHFDYVLISGGGNDLLSSARLHEIFMPTTADPETGPRHCYCATPRSPLKCVNTKVVDHYLEEIADAYRVLVRYIRARSPETVIITHTYDNFYPEPRGATFAGQLIEVGKGGWFYPAIMSYGITNPDEQRTVSNWLLQKYKQMMLALAEELGDHFVVVDTQGSMADLWNHDGRIKPQKDYWLNEIHLAPDGYDMIARKIFNAMRDWNETTKSDHITIYPD